jgi:hypothetical protein
MTRISDIEALLKRAEKQLPKIIDEYNKSLAAKSIDSELKIDIKDFFSNLRSVLDYLAHEIVEKHCPNADKKDNLYFPIRSDQPSFEALMKKSYPDLKSNCKDLYDYLLSIQPFINESNKWLSYFNKLNNENKHEKLVEQSKTETKMINVQTNQGSSVTWNPANVKFGNGVFIGGVPVNPNTQMPLPSNTQEVTIQIWVDFRFEGIDVSAIWLIKESLNKIKEIYKNINEKI